MDKEEVYINTQHLVPIQSLGVEMSRVAREDVIDLLDGAEAKAYYGLVRNYKVGQKLLKAVFDARLAILIALRICWRLPCQAFVALVDALVERGSMSGAEIRALLKENGAVPFEEPTMSEYSWTEDGALITPGYPPLKPEEESANGNGALFPQTSGYSGSIGSPYSLSIEPAISKHLFEDIKWPARLPRIPQADASNAN